MQAFFAFIAFASIWILGASLLAALPAWLLWNWLMPQIFGLPELSLIECFGLLVLVGIFFGTSSKVESG